MSSDIAVIGMSCRFPGAKNIEEFWENLKSGKETIHDFSDSELELAGLDEQLIHNSDYVKRRGIIENLEYFDAAFFGVSPYEASITDPQQKIFTEICWEALEKSGYTENNPEIVTGVFAGAGDNTYFNNFLKKNKGFLKDYQSYQASMLNSNHFLTTRVSYLLNLKGPSISVAVGCSTSLVAIAQACQSLNLYNCDVALAGGVTIRVPQACGYMYQDGAIYSVDGKCRAFDKKATGTVPANGAGVVVLKRLEDALRDGDNIEAVIKSHAVNNDGAAKAGYTSPSVFGQVGCIATALSDIDDAEDIAYVEAHGTGTILGDPIEIAALSKAFSFYTQKKNFCAVGSVKTNIGHTDVAAGVAGFIKTVLVLKHREIPASLNFTQPNPHISFENSPFYVCTKNKKLKRTTRPLYAGVSAFGIGGTNSHVILQEAPPEQQKDFTVNSKHLILLSAKTPKALIRQQNDLFDYLNHQKIDNEGLADIAYTLQTRKSRFGYSKAMICSDVDHLRGLLQKQYDQNIVTNKNVYHDKRKAVFLFQGQGNLYEGCASEIYSQSHSFKFYFDECCGYLKPAEKKKVLDYVLNVENDSVKNYKDPVLQQAATFIIEYSLAKTYIRYGIKPDVLLGHSLGEYTAVCVAEMISLKDAIELVCLRAKLTSKLSAGSMVSVPWPEERINESIKGADVVIAAINSPCSCVISGSSTKIRKLQVMFDKELAQDGKKCTELKIPFAFHSKGVDDILDEFNQTLESLIFSPAVIPVLSAVDGELIDHKNIKASRHFVEQFRRPVLFSKCIKKLIADKANVFLEVGVGQALGALVKHHQDDLVVISSLPSEKEFFKNKVDQYSCFNRALGLCWVNFINIDWNEYYEAGKKRHLLLPTYPFEKKYSWVSPTNDVIDRSGLFVYKHYWELSSLSQLKSFDKKEVWLIFGNDTDITNQLIAKLKAQKQIVVCVKMGSGFKQVDDNCYQINPGVKGDYEKLTQLLIRQKQQPNQFIHLWGLSEQGFEDSNELSKQTLKNGFFSLVNFFQVWTSHKQSTAFYLTVITNQVKAIYSKDNILPEKSTVLGLCLVLPQETNTLARVIDTDILKLSGFQQDKLIDAFLNETATHPVDSIIVYRNDLRFISRSKKYEEFALEKDPHYLRRQGVYVIVGGLGKIGLELAKFLANNYKAHLILIARKATIEKNIKRKILEIKKTASSLRILKADVSDYSQMKDAFAEIKKDFYSVDGVFHLAAKLDFSVRTLIKDMYVDQAYEQFKPKIEGTKILAKLISQVSPRFCVAFSSLSAILGGSELSSYAASNCALDSLIESYQGDKKTRWIGINWDAWENDNDKSNIKRSSLSFAQGFKLLKTCLYPTRNSRFIVSIGDLKSLAKEWVNYKESRNNILPPPGGLVSLSHVSRVDVDAKLVLKRLFEECLGVSFIDIKEDFYDLGGDSLSLLRLHEMIEKELPGKIKLMDLIRNRSVSELDDFLKDKSKPAQYSCLVKIKDSGTKQPLFLVHAVGGTVFSYIELAKHLSIDHPCIAIQDPMLESEQDPFTTIEDMAEHYLQAIQSVQSDGHYLIGGHSFGGNVAFEIVKKLEKQGKTATLFVVDGWAKYSKLIRDRDKNRDTMKRIAQETSSVMDNFIHSKERFIGLLWNRMNALFQYEYEEIKSKILLFKPNVILPEYKEVDEASNHWQKHSQKSLTVYKVNGDHSSIMRGGKVKQIADILNEYLSTEKESEYAE